MRHAGKATTITLAAIAANAMAGTAPKAWGQGNVAVSVGAGTQGGIAEAQVRLNDFLQVRGGGNYLIFDQDVSSDEVDYDGEIELVGAAGFVDLRPFRNGFILSGGALIGDKTIDLEARSDVAVEIGGETFTPDQLGRLEGDASWDDVAAYVGVGWDTTFTGDGAWGFKVLAGASFFGSPDVTLNAVDSAFSGEPLLQEALEAERQAIEEDLEDFEIYPVVQLGLTYRF